MLKSQKIPVLLLFVQAVFRNYLSIIDTAIIYKLLEPLQPLDLTFQGIVDNAANTVKYHNRTLWRVASPFANSLFITQSLVKLSNDWLIELLSFTGLHSW